MVQSTDVPRKVASFKVCFQRELNEARVDDISNYLRLSIEITSSEVTGIFEIEIKDKPLLDDDALIKYYCSLYESRLSDLELKKVSNNQC